MLPLGVAIGECGRERLGRIVLVSCLVAAGVGWFGIFYRKLYAAPHWVEPWPMLAAEAADAVRQGGEVIGNDRPFFFYLTYALPLDSTQGDAQFRGFLPETAQTQKVYSPELWVEAERPIAETMLVVSLNFPDLASDIEEAMRWLDKRCRVLDDRKLVRDYGAELKRRFMPSIPQPEWRIKVKRYACP